MSKIIKRLLLKVWSYLRHNIILPVLCLLAPCCQTLGLHDIIAFHHPFGLAFFTSWVPVLPNLMVSYTITGFGIALQAGDRLLMLILDPEGTEILRQAEEELPALRSAYEDKEEKLRQVQTELSRITASRNHYKHLFEVEEGVTQNLTDKLTAAQLELEQVRGRFNESQDLLKKSQEMLAESQSKQSKTEELYLSSEVRKNTEIETLLEKIIQPINAELELIRTKNGPKKGPAARMPFNSGRVVPPQSGFTNDKNTSAGNGNNTTTAGASTKAKPKAPEIPAVGPAPSPSQRK